MTNTLTFKERKEILKFWEENATDNSKEKTLTAQDSVNLMIEYLHWYITDKTQTKTGQAILHLIETLSNDKFDNIDNTDSSISEVRQQVMETIDSIEWVVKRSMKVVGYMNNMHRIYTTC